MQYLMAMVLALALSGTAQAQAVPQGADPAIMQQIINALHEQRNRAMDEATAAEAQLLKAQDEIKQLQTQIDKAKTPDAK